MHYPIIKNLLDTDYYKLKMLQFIWQYYPDVDVSFSLTNRTKNVRLADFMTVDELRWQLNDVAAMEFSKFDIDYLRSLNDFKPEFLKFLQDDFKLSKYYLSVSGDGQIELEFHGKWLETSMWEIYALSIVNELRNRCILNGSDVKTDLLYANARIKLDRKLYALQIIDAKFSDFSTRRRHSFAHQYWACKLASYRTPKNYIGSSNVYISHMMDTKPIGTNAHEIPMVAAALANSDIELQNSQYDVLDKWAEMYPNNKIMLPDTFGSVQFLRNAPSYFATNWDGIRVDSMEPNQAAELIYDFYTIHGVDPKTKTVIFSDGLDVNDIINLNHRYGNRFNLMFGWGTLFGNDFRDCSDVINVDPISIVCKVKTVNGRSAVKLSDERNKFLGEADEIKRYLNVFGANGITEGRVQIV